MHGNRRQGRDPAMTANLELTRRSLVCGGLAISLLPALARSAQATPAEMADAIRELTGSTAVKPGRVKLVLPELAENGNIVSLAVSVDSPMTEADRVKAVHIFSEMNPITTLVRLHVSPRAGRNPTLLTNIRLAELAAGDGDCRHERRQLLVGRGQRRGHHCRLHRRRLRRASVMIEKFAGVRGMVLSEFADLNRTSKPMILVSLMIPKFARDASCEVWRTSESGH